MAKKQKTVSWQEEAWEKLLTKVWDARPHDRVTAEYTKADLDPILRKYTKSGQGEIRIFHSGSNRLEPLKRRGVGKIPLTRSKWVLVRSAAPIDFQVPKDVRVFVPVNPLTPGMLAGIRDTMKKRSNPGETTMLAIANHSGLLGDFYGLEGRGALFTGGRQAAGIKLDIGGGIDVSKAQIEIDGGFEWESDVVIAEVKSSFSQPDFDLNQALIPVLKWRTRLPNKKVHSLVLLGETNEKGVEFRVYDLEVDTSNDIAAMNVQDSRKYVIEVESEKKAA